MELNNAQQNPRIPQKMTKNQKCAKENCTKPEVFTSSCAWIEIHSAHMKDQMQTSMQKHPMPYIMWTTAVWIDEVSQ